MAWLSVNKDGRENITSKKPKRHWAESFWYYDDGFGVRMPSGSIQKLIGRELTWEDSPVEI